MMTVAQAFDQLLRNLELTDAQRGDASRQQNELRDRLRQHLGGVARDILAGSYSRGTAIRPLHDIDLFVILDRSAHSDVYPSALTQSPLPCLQKLQGALARAYPGKGTPRLQRRSVHIEFSGTGIGYDVVPAFEVSGGMYMIPDASRSAWIKTNPERHRDLLVAANQRAGSKLNPLIKLGKLWKREHAKQHQGFPLGSFHLEVMAYGAFPAPPASYPLGLRSLFEHLAAAVRSTCADPASAGPNVDHGTNQQERDRVYQAARSAAGVAAQALALDGQGKVEEAHYLWRQLLGPDYPERGRAPQGR